eukprot:jgi/Botrbrau1/3150/Bobra.0070s0116.1
MTEYMWQTLCTVSLMLYTSTIACRQDAPVLNFSDEEYYQFFQRSWLKYRDASRTSTSVRTECLIRENMPRHLVSSPHEVARLVVGRHTLFGPGINATSLPTLLYHLDNLERVVYSKADIVLLGTDVPVKSAFLGPSLGNVPAAGPSNNKCLFDPLQYSTVIYHYDLGISLASTCWRVISRKDRNVMRSVLEGALHTLGYPDVHVLSMLSGYLYYPHPWTKYLSRVQSGPWQETLNVTLEVFGPCAVPFVLEKQTLLRKVLPLVLERDIDMGIILVKKVHHSQIGNDLEESVNVTMTIGVFVDEFAQSPYLQAFQDVTTSKKGEEPALIRHLSQAGLTTTRVVVHEVYLMENPPPDSSTGSIQAILRQAEQEAAAGSAIKGIPAKKQLPTLPLALTLVLMVLPFLLSACFNHHREGWWPPDVREVLVRKHMSSPASSSSSTMMCRQWVGDVMEEIDVKLVVDANGISCLLGSGASAEVFQGVYRGSEPVAIKVIKNITSDGPQQDKFLKEVAVLRSCSHPHIVSFKGVTFVEDKLCLVMELMSGGDLARALWIGETYRWTNRGPQVAADIASALAYLHSHAFIHMDVKSANVLLTQDGRAKLGDVGVATWLTSLQTHASLPCWTGTFPYAAPEILVSKKRIAAPTSSPLELSSGRW